MSEDDTTAGGTENEPCAPVSALRYTLKGEGQAIGRFTIEVSEDGSVYTKVKEGSFDLKEGSQTVYFENGEDPWVATYDAAYVRLTATGQQGQELSITELDLFGPSGDNVDFLTGDGKAAIGTLKEDYQYGQKEEDMIPKGSLIFTGTYKGNPAYNVVMLYDEKGNIVGGTDNEGVLCAQQIILAPNSGDALLGEIKPDGGGSGTTPDSGNGNGSDSDGSGSGCCDRRPGKGCFLRREGRRAEDG